MKNKGQIPFISVVIGGVLTAVTAWGGAWITGSMSASRELFKVNTDLQVVKTTEDLHYKEVVKILERIEKNIDKIAPATVPKLQQTTIKK